MARRSFKSEESFLEKLAIGAMGTRQVISDLLSQGHQAIELERGSTGFKIWKSIKIKRVRVPDILCVNTGIRVESRAKTSLVISMSHSTSEEARGWDYGLEDNDYTALVVCDRVGERPIDWLANSLVQYVPVSALRAAYNSNNVITEKPKGAEEGFESRLTWPAAVASGDGTVSSVSADRLQFKRATDNRTITLSCRKQGIQLRPLVQVGDQIRKNKILASVVDVAEAIPLVTQVDSTYYLQKLSSSSLSDRYCAAKAFSYLPIKNHHDTLIQKLNDDAEHIYVRLEVAATLARVQSPDGIKFIRKVLSDSYLEHRLEAVIILGEIKTDEACLLLQEVLKDESQDPEIRGGAAWSLGEMNNTACIPDLIKAFLAVHTTIQIEAARALAKLCEENTPQILEEFPTASEQERSGIAWALSKRGKWNLDDILSHTPLKNYDAKHWAAYILGSNDESRIISDIEKLKKYDSEMYFAVTLLWKLMSSWVYNLEEY